MKVRRLDYETDLEDVVDLFNRSFPIEISRDFFSWKHRDNPFGSSYGLVAVEGEKIVGLRMFMKWKFSVGNKIVKAIRPVDTCTDPNFRGKGIFKMLTLQGLEDTRGEYDFIFNTPNSNSIDGYLSMGWREIDKSFCYYLGFINPFSKRKKFRILEKNDLNNDVVPTFSKGFSTQLSQSYLRWRYNSSNYNIAEFKDETIVVYRLEKIKGLRAIIYLEVFGDEENTSSYLTSIALHHGTFLVYYLKNDIMFNKGFLFSLKRANQKVVTKNDDSIDNKELNFSAGDLEGII